MMEAERRDKMEMSLWDSEWFRMRVDVKLESQVELVCAVGKEEEA